MAIRFHHQGYDNAVRLIEANEVDTFNVDWNEVKPDATEMVDFINTHYMKEYGLWFLGVDDSFPTDAKEHYVYPHGDLHMVQLCALVHTIKRAEGNGDDEIVRAAQRLFDMIEEKR